MSKYTPEPWTTTLADGELTIQTMYKLCPGGELAPDGGRIRIVYGRDHPLTIDDAIRIERCVNACKGLNPEAVPKLVEALEAVLREHDETYVVTPTTLESARAALADLART